MNGKKKFAVAGIMALVLAGLVIGLVWHMNHYVFVDMKFYPKDAALLDLREEELSISRYEKLHRQLPGCEILWNVPFQDGLYESDITELTVTELTDADLDRLDYFPQLETLHAEGCTDYTRLTALRERRPELKLLYKVTLSGQSYGQDASQVTLSGITAEELALLPCLPQLTSVTVSGGESMENIAALQTYCHENGLTFSVTVGDSVIPETAEELNAAGITDGELALLQLLPQLKTVHLTDPQAAAENLLALREARPDLDISWEVEIWGKVFQSTETEVDLSQGEVTSLEDVERGMTYLPDVKNVFLGLPGIDNEEIAAYRERSRDKYKVVWVVDLSGRMQVRTDIDNFMPSRDGWGYVRDGEVDNIRYCEDLICIDLGHMGIRNVDFLEPLVNLEYLILAHSEVQYIPAVSNCKKLKYLELDWSPIKDLTPLLECTALEDLNIGMAWPDITPVLEMTWLKNLYMIKGSARDAWKCTQALPDTRVIASGEYTVASGWRHLPNYYKMRDILGMYYMDQ